MFQVTNKNKFKDTKNQSTCSSHFQISLYHLIVLKHYHHDSSYVTQYVLYMYMY